MKKRFLLGIAFAGLLALTSCAKDNTPTTVKSLPLYDYNDMYELKNNTLDTYYLADSDIPYVSVSGYIKSMDGSLESSNFSYSANTLFQEYVVKSKLKSNTFSIIFDYKNDKILTTYTYGFQNTTDITSTIDYSFNLSTSTDDVYAGKTVTFDLGKYGIDLRYINGNCLVPFQVMNALFGHQNYLSTYYTGKSYYNTYFSVAYSENGQEIFNKLAQDSSSSLNSQELRDFNYKYLCFYFDYFYGLTEFKGIGSFSDYLKGDIETNLKSTNPDTYMKGYVGLVQKLNELHTSIHNYSPTASNNRYSLYEGEFEASSFKKAKETTTALTAKAKEHFGDALENKVEIEGNTCFIFFRNFKTGVTTEVRDAAGNILEDAYKNDSFYLFLKAFEIIKASETPIKNIVVDLSINGGGNTGALYRTLGFVSRGYLVSDRDSLTKIAYTQKILVDTNNDGRYNNEDSYPDYNWYVLTSNYSYSSANMFTHISKDNNSKVKVIGEQAGGGGCSILPFIGIDGTSLQISGTNQNIFLTRNGTSYSYEVLENGPQVDYEISYDRYYDRAYLNAYLNTLR